MSITVECPKCRRSLRVPESAGGRRGKCPACGERMDIPSRSEDPESALFELDDVAPAAPSPPVPDWIGRPASGIDLTHRPAADYAPRVEPPKPFTYRMVQIPPNVQMAAGGGPKATAATYLEQVVNEYAAKGWEFFRVDEIGVYNRPGCLARLFGITPTRTGYYVLTFRRQVEE